MKALSKAAVLTVAAGVTVLGSAAGVLAHDHDNNGNGKGRDHGNHNGGYGGHGNHNGGHGNHRDTHDEKHFYHHDNGGEYNEYGGAHANGLAAGSPGVVSGNNIQVPINIPINLCGNTINAVGFLNPAMGNICINR
ncbi:chaplin [Streptomyces sp. LX-29]|uniref:chaplin n=1 Tax=Streptomyces sp. LX-29 TaxID=2900152 RepID=UPI00240E84EA|nr:chaplin [Streptomyces sp. LX-29]WFB09727.1 chaplin [Streptomyces sp. LX-29]